MWRINVVQVWLILRFIFCSYGYFCYRQSTRPRNLSGCNLTGAIPNAFRELSQLIALYLSWCPIFDAQQYFLTLGLFMFFSASSLLESDWAFSIGSMCLLLRVLVFWMQLLPLRLSRRTGIWVLRLGIRVWVSHSTGHHVRWTALLESQSCEVQLTPLRMNEQMSACWLPCFVCTVLWCLWEPVVDDWFFFCEQGACRI
jgi:hypothetical protein